MDQANKVIDTLTSMQNTAPNGFTAALHLNFSTSRFLFQTYPPKWVAHYAQSGFFMSDPVVHWTIENTGFCHWSDLNIPDPNGVLQAAADHGIPFGVACAVDTNGSRSIAGFSHATRAFTDAEAADLLGQLTQLHSITTAMPCLPEFAMTHLQGNAMQVLQTT